MVSARDWRQRFQQQAGWTRAMRHFLYRRFEVTAGKRVLEVGCGTGAITSDLASTFAATIVGLDHNLSFLSEARSLDATTQYLGGDAFFLPFASDTFDVVICHFLLLWVRDITAVLADMRRITKPGGVVMALAEPDYGGRIDFPDALSELGQWQAISLNSQGANPNTGRKLMAEFLNGGFRQVETGLMGGQWKSIFDPSAFELEWKMLEADLDGFVSPARLQALKRMDEVAHRKGERILFVPTFYATGKKPE